MVFFVSGINVIGLGLGIGVGGMFFGLGGGVMLSMIFCEIFVFIFEVLMKVICFF